MERLNRILQQYVADDHETKQKILGAAFIVVDKNGTIFEGAAGRVDLPLSSAKFACNSLSWVASMTKIITATCLMQLVEKNLIHLDDDVRNIVPQLGKMQILRGFDSDGQPILENNMKPITLRNLLTHTTGLGYDIADPDLMKWHNAVGRTVTNLSFSYEGWNTPLKFSPGEGWYYGSAVDWAGKVLEVVTGLSLGQYMAEHVFRPLGMRDTTFHVQRIAAQIRDRTVGWAIRNTDTNEITTESPPIPLNPPSESGGAGLHTTAADHARFLQSILAASAEGETTGPCLVQKSTVDEMFRPQLTNAQRQMLHNLTAAFPEAMTAEFPSGTQLDHGISGIINTEDIPGKRRRGSMMWLGMCNGHWWIDRKTGIGATLLVHIRPQPDHVVNALYRELETAVYEDLLSEIAK